MRAIWPFLLQQCVLYISQCTAAVIGETPGHAHGSNGRGRYLDFAAVKPSIDTHAHITPIGTDEW